MTELQVRVGDARIERKRPSVGNLGLRQLVGVAQLAGLLQRVTILDPNGRIMGISAKNPFVEPGREIPLPHASGPIRECDDTIPAKSHQKTSSIQSFRRPGVNRAIRLTLDGLFPDYDPRGSTGRAIGRDAGL